MAEEVSIAASHRRAKIRHPAAPLLLGIVTLGIYTVVWWYMINRELRDLGEERKAPGLGDNPTLSLLAFLFGGFLLYIPTIWTIVTTAQRIQRGQRLVGNENVMNGWGLAALWVFTLGLGAIVYMQVCLNRIWRTQPPALPASSAGESDLERLKKLQEFRESGAISDDEFEAEKARLLPTQKPT
jgi:Domain of unknown function (DUF4234)/Short C-terminal domain